MSKIGNFSPSTETKVKAEEITRAENEKYSSISEIVCESQFNGGLLFELEVEMATSKGTND